jgi:rhodanese-related sulfurtransferase
MKQKLINGLFVVALLTVALSGNALAMGELSKTVKVEQVTDLQKAGTLVLDVREVTEYAEAHVSGSTLIPLGQLAQRLQELGADKSKPVVLICRSGRRSAQALAILEQAGFSAASNVEGGMLAWQKAGLPVVTGSASK